MQNGNNKRPYETYENSLNKRRRYESNNNSYEMESRREMDAVSPDQPYNIDSLEVRINRLVLSVQAQPSIVHGKLILMHNLEGTESALQLLHEALAAFFKQEPFELKLQEHEHERNFTLSVKGEVLAEGTSWTKKSAKNELAAQALKKLARTCFIIHRKKLAFKEITMDDITKMSHEIGERENASMNDNIGFDMMVKMGWNGKGLGKHEQGMESMLVITNPERGGFGNSEGNSKTFFQEIQRTLEDYANTAGMKHLTLDCNFSKEERSLIHSIANKLHLQSKSLGQGELRKITVFKKIPRIDMVRALLKDGCENECYRLEIPEKFQRMWKDSNIKLKID